MHKNPQHRFNPGPFPRGASPGARFAKIAIPLARIYLLELIERLGQVQSESEPRLTKVRLPRHLCLRQIHTYSTYL